MTTAEILSTLRERGVTLAVEDGKLLYRGSKDVLTPELIGEMRRCKAELIALIEAEQAAASAAPASPSARPRAPTIPRAGRDQPIALAPPQESLWFLHKVAPDNVADHVWAAWSLVGRLDRTAFARTLDTLIARHEALRLHMIDDGAQGLQRVSDPFPAPLEYHSIRHLAPVEREAEQARILKAFYRRPIDLLNPPLIRFLLLEVDHDHHVMQWVGHHIIMDGGSLAVMQQDFAACYAAYAAGREPELADLEVQYPDFAVWQRGQLEGARLDELEAFWKEAIPAGLAPLELPLDHPRPPVQSFDGGDVSFHLSREVTEAMRKTAGAAGCTLFVAFLSTLKLLLHRLSGQEHISVGAPMFLRDEPELAPIVGMLLNTLPIATTIDDDPTIRDLMRRERRALMDAFTHKQLPFQKLVEAVAPPRDPSRNPLFQVMFEMLQDQDFVLPGLEAKPLRIARGVSQFDMAVHFREETGGGIEGFLEYASDLFDAATMERFLGHWRVVIESVASNPDLKVSEVPLLSSDEREAMLVDWNATATPYAAGKGIHHLISEAAAARPDATALVCGADSLTFADLEARANRLARHLKRLGVGRDVAVGLSLERSLDLVVGALAILKAGGAYVPMDPAYPRDRRGFMVEDSAAPVIVTAADLVDDLPAHDAHVVRIDADWPAIEALSAAPLADADFSADQLAYVIFTSGSTGRPKGVMVEHRNASNFFTAMDGVIAPDAATPGTWLAVTSLSFDISVLELFWTLARGFKVVIYAEAADAGEDSAGSVPSLIAAHEVTHMQCVPAMARMQVASAAGARAFGRLHKLLIGGEAFPGALAQDLLAHVGGDVINMYGPTETTVWSSSHPAVKGVDTVPIGRPVANTEFYVLDGYGEPVPVGVPGELFIGGAGVTRGYIGRDDLTAERFIENRFSPSGGRLYRTGDRVAYRPDGVLDYLGRLDFQVKIRGFRIELGEIEAAVAEVAPVPVTAVVGTWAPQPDDVRLVAYLETDQADAIEAAALREALKARLPDYMVPQHVVTLDRFPQTANGKIDRKRLPEPLQIAKSRRPQPATTIEREIAELWQARLYVSDIASDDSFFDLGGHSLSAVEVASDIATAFDVDFTPRDLMQDPTLAGVVRRVEELSGASPDGNDATLDEAALSDILPAGVLPPGGVAGDATTGRHPSSLKRHESFWKGLKNRVLQVIALHAPGMSTLRVRLHRARGVKIGERITIGTDVLLETSSPHLIEIGNNVQIGVRATFIAHFGDLTPTGPDAAPTIRIEDDVYIGPSVTILPNVTIGRGSVVTAGSVVNQSIPPGTVAQGNPARPVARCAVPLAWRSYTEFAKNLSPIASPRPRKVKATRR